MDETEIPPPSSPPSKQGDKESFNTSDREEEEKQDPKDWLLPTWKQSIILVSPPSISQGNSYPTNQPHHSRLLPWLGGSQVEAANP